jgi:NDP-sugar pyrophosphorylase family protein
VVEIEVNCKIEEEHKIEEVVKIVVNCKIEEEVIGHLGWDFRVDFGVHFWCRF